MTAAVSTGQLMRAGAGAGVAAAVCTTVVAAVAKATGVSLEVDGQPIPVAAFPWWTIVATVLGLVLVRALRERRRFVVVAVAATCLSLVPAIALPDDVATTCVLVAAHLLAAAIVIPLLARLAAVSTHERR